MESGGSAIRHRVVIVGGGFGGVYTAIHLAKLWRGSKDVSVTLVSRENYFLMTPFLFEAGSGVLDPRHAVTAIRRLLDPPAQFVEADVEGIDFDRKAVTVRHAPDTEPYDLPYDQLVLALGGVTNLRIIPGSEHAMTFKTLADAIYWRNHVIDMFEYADTREDDERRRVPLSFAIVGAGLVGVELMGELTSFVRNIARSYPTARQTTPRYYLVEAGPHILPEMERDLADYAAKVLRDRGVDVRTGTPVRRIEPGRLHLPDGSTIDAGTIVLAAGVAPNPMLASFPLEKDRKGRLVVDGAMRCASRSDVWAIGDCASIPDPEGKPYPQLAQHALREARVLARNITETLRGTGKKSEPFVYKTLGTLASLGHYDGVGRVMKVKLRGFPAWWVWRSYYLMQMPRFERKLRIMLDWTVALFFRNDIVKLDLFGQEHPIRQKRVPPNFAGGEGVTPSPSPAAESRAFAASR